MDSTDVRHDWAERSGEYSPAYYAYYGPNETSEIVRSLLARRVGTDASVLELGCSSGRHLSHLFDEGFHDLAGIELNADAADVMAEAYPDLASKGTFYLDAIEDVVVDFEDDQFDAVYSVQTLQHLHPDVAWVFDELVRIAGELLVTVENEGEREDVEEMDGDSRGDAVELSGDPPVSHINDEFPLYHRNWGKVFSAQDCRELDVVSEIGVDVPGDHRETVRAFHPPSENRNGTGR